MPRRDVLLPYDGKVFRRNWLAILPDRQGKAAKLARQPGRGSRTIWIQNIHDRVVQRATMQILQPLLDPLFDPRSFGYPGGATVDYESAGTKTPEKASSARPEFLTTFSAAPAA